MGQALAAALERVPTLVDALSRAAGEQAPCADEAWAAVGALAVLGGHVDSVHVGGQVRASAEGSRSAGVVLALGRSSAVISPDSADGAYEAEAAGLEPVAEVVALAWPRELDALLSACASLMPCAEEGRSPLLALLQSKALKSVHALLASEQGERAGAQLLHRGLFAHLLRAAALPVPVASGPVT